MMLAPEYAFQLPQKLTPIGAAISAGDGGIASSLFIPIDVIVTVKDNIMRIDAEQRAKRAPALPPEPVAPEIN
jgi:hypothetical protein